MKLNAEQERALNKLMRGGNWFLTGEAGTGKTTVMLEFTKRTKKNVVVAAPTGVSAVNIGGVTIHNLFRFPATALDPNKLPRITDSKKKQLLHNIEVLVIDEISMVRSDLFAAIDYRLRQFGRGDKPFGGKQVIVVGDFFQLSPVVSTKEEGVYLKSVFGGPYCFQTNSWGRAGFDVIELTQIHRQCNDPTYAKLLSAVRYRCLETTLGGTAIKDILGSRVIEPEEDTITLCTTRRDADKINMTKLEQLKGEQRRFEAQVTGNFKPSQYPVEAEFYLKVGERVMSVSNKYGKDLLYCNGDMGTVLSFESNGVKVKFDKGLTIVVEPFEWTDVKYTLNKNGGRVRIEPEEDGSFTQIPLKPAYAVTIHKSQGLSLDKAHLSLVSLCFAPGQLYTAMSRVRNLNGLTLSRKIEDREVFFDVEVVKFFGKAAEKRKKLEGAAK